ncbi:hypothetical protein DSL72_003689 [Monilinia vaccinii-corymbosi]|uniref:Uncharacterized protein n=1 Tax=Monilinia vaccinii-corymbosi TaxID=61207 RepID=A0A8A3P6C6_9HELO|nr:hypothetical protein DSL72_003689 [Monilinia vaccinii-corymbosi]
MGLSPSLPLALSPTSTKQSTSSTSPPNDIVTESPPPPPERAPNPTTPPLPVNPPIPLIHLTQHTHRKPHTRITPLQLRPPQNQPPQLINRNPQILRSQTARVSTQRTPKRVERQARRRKHAAILLQGSADHFFGVRALDDVAERRRFAHRQPVAADVGEFAFGARDGVAEDAFGAGAEGCGMQEFDAVAVGCVEGVVDGGELEERMWWAMVSLGEDGRPEYFVRER